MFGGGHRRGWRGAICLIAAYALVLQAFLAYSIAVPATAQDSSSYADFFLCAPQDHSDTPDGGRRADPCPLPGLYAVGFH